MKVESNSIEIHVEEQGKAIRHSFFCITGAAPPALGSTSAPGWRRTSIRLLSIIAAGVNPTRLRWATGWQTLQPMQRA